MRQLFTALFCVLATLAGAQNKPFMKAFSDQGFIFGRLSDNGRWTTRYQEVEPTKTPQVIDLTTYQAIDLQTTADILQHGYAVPIDISDDGNTVVGSYDGVPAFLDRATGRWTRLSDLAGCVFAVTPDGRYGVGSVNNGGTSMDGEQLAWYTDETPHLWDLTTGLEVAVTPLPALDPLGLARQSHPLTRFTDISPDGRYIVGSMFVDYPDFAFVIDREAGTCRFVGFDGDALSGKGTPFQSDLFFISPRALSPSGEWLVCSGYFLDNDEYYAPVRHNLLTGETIAYNASADDQDMYANAIDNLGNVYAATPAGSPIREFYIRSGRYWYSLRSVLAQRYGINFATATGLDNTGTPYGVSADGRTFTSMVDPQFGQNYVLKTTESLVDVCNGLNLLGVYTITPAPDAQFTTLSQIRIRFDRDIEVVGVQTAATFGTWNSLGGNGIYVDPTDSRTVVVAFRPRRLDAGQRYTFTLPAGTIAVKGDRDRTNDLITATFRGRADQPVALQGVYPSEGSLIARLDNTSSYIQLTFDCNVLVSDDASARLEVDGGQRVCDLQIAYKDNVVALFPATTQHLYLGTGYTVTLAKGAVTDVMGGGATVDDIVLHYQGSYERETSQTGGVLFADNFDNISNSLAQWLLYEGDHLTPADDMAEMEFDADNTPWNFSIHESSESTDYCAASHSCYKPAGQSSDWMLTPQIYIPDDLARLTFQAQSYRMGKADELQVYVWAYDKPITYLTANHINLLRANAECVLSERLTPGADEEMLSGDWQDFTVDLSSYAGQNVYIAFANENRDQSMLFVDNVRVYRQLPFTLALTTPEAVVGLSEIAIEGRITLPPSDEGVSEPRLTLLDAEGNTLETVAPSDGRFAFTRPLPLQVGEVNRYGIRVTIDGVATDLDYTLRDLAFMPVKRVVLEEMTGQPCGNCPQGIVAIERMERMFGEQFVPISIHTYTGDPWGAGLEGYTSYLNIMAAPTGVVQRRSGIISPMVQVGGRYTMSDGSNLWLDRVALELETPADINLTASVAFDPSTRVFTVPITMRSALNLDNQNLNLLLVLMEDGLVARQRNYFASSTDEIFGEWGLGGRYAQNIASDVVHNDVVRAVIGNSYAGTVGLLPQTLQAGREYQPSRTLGGTLPDIVEEPANAKVAVLLIDANTGAIVNAAVARFRDADAIDTVSADGPTDTDAFYSLQGQRLSHPRGTDGTARGLVITGRRLLLIR